MSWLCLGWYYIIILSRIGLSYHLYMLCALMLQQGSQKIWIMSIQRIQIPNDLFNIIPSGKYSFVEHDDSSCVHDKSEDMIRFFTDMKRTFMITWKQVHVNTGESRFFTWRENKKTHNLTVEKAPRVGSQVHIVHSVLGIGDKEWYNDTVGDTITWLWSVFVVFKGGG